MRITKLHYVFSLIFILFIGLSEPGFAQKKERIQKGLATWYGSKYHGKKTSSGEVYNMHRMTAAHPTLPFGTKVKVTNPNNKKSIVVRINDRGPFGNKARIIDLSEAAARKIQVFEGGESQVTVEIISASVWMEEDKNNLMALVPATGPEEIQPTTIPYTRAQVGTLFSQIPDLSSLEENTSSVIQLNEVSSHSRKINRIMESQFANEAPIEEVKTRLDKRILSGLLKQLAAAS